MLKVKVRLAWREWWVGFESAKRHVCMQPSPEGPVHYDLKGVMVGPLPVIRIDFIVQTAPKRMTPDFAQAAVPVFVLSPAHASRPFVEPSNN